MLFSSIQDSAIFLLYLVITLILTIGVELAAWRSIAALSKEFKLEHIWLAIIAVNIATNPALNIILSIIDPLRNHMFLEIGFEISIIFIEASLLYIIYKKAFGRFLAHSAIMNSASYIIGLLIFRPSWLR